MGNVTGEPSALINRPAVVALDDLGGGVAQLTLEDRQHRNTFSEALVRELTERFAAVTKDQAFKVVVLTGYDTYFASGGTKQGLLAIHGGQTSFNVTNFYSLPLDCEIPVVSAMQGHG